MTQGAATPRLPADNSPLTNWVHSGIQASRRPALRPAHAPNDVEGGIRNEAVNMRRHEHAIDTLTHAPDSGLYVQASPAMGQNRELIIAAGG
jgi:hypothetical protein